MSTAPAGVEPQTAALLARLVAVGVRPIESLSVQDARDELAALARLRPGPQGVCSTREFEVPVAAGVTIRTRLYQPEGVRGPAPAIVYFHGGGHVIGSIDTHDDLARRIALGAGAALFSVGYRKGPEARFPAAVEDAWQALRWLTARAHELGLDEGRLAVMGDSAGANLATVCALRARDCGGLPLSLQVLVYPVADYRLRAQSFVRYASGYGVLSTAAMHWFRAHYLSWPQDADDWRASPILAPSMAGVAPAVVLAAECDPLVDDVRAYVARLLQGGVSVDYVEYPGTVHGFFANPHVLDAARDAHVRVARSLRLAWRLPSMEAGDGRC